MTAERNRPASGPERVEYLKQRNIDPREMLLSSMHPLALVIAITMNRYNQLAAAEHRQPLGITADEMTVMLSKLHTYPLNDIYRFRESSPPHQPRQSYAIQSLPNSKDASAAGWRDVNRATVTSHLNTLAKIGVVSQNGSSYSLVTDSGLSENLSQRDRKLIPALFEDTYALYKTFWGMGNAIEDDGYPTGFLERIQLADFLLNKRPTQQNPTTASTISTETGIDIRLVMRELTRLGRMNLITNPHAEEQSRMRRYSFPSVLVQTASNLPHVPDHLERKSPEVGLLRSIIAREAASDPTRQFTVKEIILLVEQEAERLGETLSGERRLRNTIEDSLKYWADQGIINRQGTGPNIPQRKKGIFLTQSQELHLLSLLRLSVLSEPIQRRSQDDIFKSPKYFAQLLQMIHEGAVETKPSENKIDYYDSQVLSAVLRSGKPVNVENLLEILGRASARSYSREHIIECINRLLAENIVHPVETIGGKGNYYELNGQTFTSMDLTALSERQRSFLLEYVFANRTKIPSNPLLLSQADFLITHYPDFLNNFLKFKKLLSIALQTGIVITTKGEVIAIGRTGVREALSTLAQRKNDLAQTLLDELGKPKNAFFIVNSSTLFAGGALGNNFDYSSRAIIVSNLSLITGNQGQEAGIQILTEALSKTLINTYGQRIQRDFQRDAQQIVDSVISSRQRKN